MAFVGDEKDRRKRDGEGVWRWWNIGGLFQNNNAAGEGTKAEMNIGDSK